MHIHENTLACTRVLTHNHIRLPAVYAHTLIYAHTEGPQCSGHLQYWTQTQAWSLYLHVNGLQQSAAPLVCSVPPAVWAWGRELLVRWGDHIRWAPVVMEPNASKREGRGCLPGSHWNSRDSHISWKWSMVWSPSLTGEQGRGLSKRPSCLKGMRPQQTSFTFNERPTHLWLANKLGGTS